MQGYRPRGPRPRLSAAQPLALIGGIGAGRLFALPIRARALALIALSVGACRSSDESRIATAVRGVATGAMSEARSGHTATLLTDGRVIAIGGGASAAEVFDPSATAGGTDAGGPQDVGNPDSGTAGSGPGAWLAAGTASVARFRHTAVLLENGRVFIAGGSAGGATVGSTELYEPWAQSFAAGPTLAGSRESHTATRLADGTVLITGGVRNRSAYLNTCEIYDPVAGTLVATGSLASARAGHTATLLHDGRVLACGGLSGGASLASCEIYEPSAGTWSATGAMIEARDAHSATVLAGDRLLVAGGRGAAPLASAEIYDPATGTWSATGALATARFVHSATLLPWGWVIVTGGFGGSANLASVEVYDPIAGTWSAGTALDTTRREHVATLLPSGVVLVSGGIGGPSDATLASAEIVTVTAPPTAASWRQASSMITGRSFHTATLLPNGAVLVAGSSDNSGISLSVAELYDPATSTWSAAPAMADSRGFHTATLLQNGTVLVAGGAGAGFSFASAELYDPTTNTWSAAGPMAVARFGHTATLLQNGMVLVAGGWMSPTTLASAELYNPATNTWSAAGSMATARIFHTATLFRNGMVLVAGGVDFLLPAIFASAELYNPTTNTWSPAGSMAFARDLHTATLLQNDMVLVAGRFRSAVAVPAELYDPATNTWSAAGLMATARGAHTATLLPNGAVLVAGGDDWSSGGYGEPSGALSSTELYDPATGTWSTSASMVAAREGHTATLLRSGRVLVAGGNVGIGRVIDSAALFHPGSTGGPAPVVGGAARAAPGETITLTGSGLRGLSEGSSGGAQSSAANHPVVDFSSGTASPRVVEFSDTRVRVSIPCATAVGETVLVVTVNGAAATVPITIAAGGCFCGAGTACDDGVACTRDDTCDATNACVGTAYTCTPTECQATSACNGTGSCDTTSRPDGMPCADDGNECTTDECIAGACAHAPVAANTPCDDDGDQCTGDVCNVSGVCTHPSLANGTRCDDSNPCTLTDVCSAGNCGGRPRVCDTPPAASCLSGTTSRVHNAIGICQVGDGSCVYTFNDVGCTACGGSCSEITGLCTGDPCCGVSCGAPPNAHCYQAAGACSGGACSYAQRPAGTSCSDGNSCTTGDVCSAAGECGGTIYSCPAPGVCQDRVDCDGAGGCVPVNSAAGTPCSDGDLCTRNDICNGLGACSGGAFTCTPGQCDSAAACDGTGCTFTRRTSGTTCDDQNACTRDDVCDGTGGCGGTAYTCSAPTECQLSVTCDGAGGCGVVDRASGTACSSDGLSCTDDLCDGAGACTHPLSVGACLIGGTCYASGASSPTNPCLACAPETSTSAWSPRPNGTACPDDGVSCTADICDGAGACTHAVAPTTCLVGGTCYASGTLDPVNACLACVPATSHTAFGALPSGTACPDDGVSCTDDVCDGAGACTHPVEATRCLVAGICYASGATDPANSCQGCVPATSRTAFSGLPSGTACSSATICGGTCAMGACAGGVAVECDDENPCTRDGCDPGTSACTHEPVADGVDCDDRDSCNGADTCMAGTCMHAGAPDCDDGESCTRDSCDPVRGCVNTPATDGTNCGAADLCRGEALCAAGRCQAGAPRDCDDGDPCTDDSCGPVDGCLHTRVAGCGADAGAPSPDAAPPSMAERGPSDCGCSASERPRTAPMDLFALAALALRRRHRAGR